jgi:hypothetical protein
VRSVSVGTLNVAACDAAGPAAALWVDPAVHAEECRRFDSFVVRGPAVDDCDFFIGAIGTDGYGRFFRL